jgi:nicotinate-nucleotide adenylyltransferase
MHTIAIFGGTFDPVHNGHLKTSLAIQKEFQFNSYRFLPCKSPVIKKPSTANTKQRIEMLRMAIQEYPEFSIDLREIKRDSPSFMSETLESFRQEYPEASISLILGYDAFLSLPKWHRWEQLIKLAHLLIINREYYAETPLPQDLIELIKTNKQTDKKSLASELSGIFFEYNAGDYAISSTDIRKALSPKKELQDQLPHSVYEYIKQQQLYTQKSEP